MIANMLTKEIGKIQFCKLRIMVGWEIYLTASEEECWKLISLARLLNNILEELSGN